MVVHLLAEHELPVQARRGRSCRDDKLIRASHGLTAAHDQRSRERRRQRHRCCGPQERPTGHRDRHLATLVPRASTFQPRFPRRLPAEQTGLVAQRRWRVPPRRIALLALVVGLTMAGFLGARLLGERDARRDSEHQAEVAAAQIHARLADAASLAASLGRYMASVGGTGVTNEEFASNAAKWLSPAGFPAAGWVEEVGAADRAAYEQRTGNPIVTRDQRRRIVRRRISVLLPARNAGLRHPSDHRARARSRR